MKDHIVQCIARIVILIIVLLTLYPLLLMISLSMWRSSDVLHLYQQQIPHFCLPPPVFSLEQFVLVIFEQSSYADMFINSLLLSVSISLTAVTIDFLAGYVLSKLHFCGSKLIYHIYVFMALLPAQVILLPIYIASRTLHLINSWWSIVLPGIFSPLGVFFMRQFLVAIPDEIFACMRLETSSTMRLLLHGILPYARSGLITLFVILFSENWAMVEQPLLLLSDPSKFPLSLALCSKESVPLDIAFAGAVIFTLPALVLYTVFQDQIQDGIGGIQLK